MTFFEDFSTFVTIGPIHIQWYAVCILTGACIAYFLGQYRFKQLGYSKDILSDYFFAVLLIIVIISLKSMIFHFYWLVMPLCLAY